MDGFRERPVDPDPMPVFTIKAKDRLACAAINHYLGLCEDAGLETQAEEVHKALQEFRDWQARNRHLVQFPDHGHVPARPVDTCGYNRPTLDRDLCVLPARRHLLVSSEQHPDGIALPACLVHVQLARTVGRVLAEHVFGPHCAHDDVLFGPDGCHPPD
jgi:hypothetical protein